MLKEIAFKLVNPVVVFDRPRTLEQTVVYSGFFRGIFRDVLSTDSYDKDKRHYNQVDSNNQIQSYDIILSYIIILSYNMTKIEHIGEFYSQNTIEINKTTYILILEVFIK